ncbi:MAG: 5'/3'-nucleotidase SurE [Chloroflexota bacterium]
MRILLTNDDGITSDGLWAAARGLARIGHLTVIGTAEDWSGGSASIRLSYGARLARFSDIPPDLGPNVEAYSLEAAPGGAILTGLMTGLFAPFDLVASGANYGINVGADLVHSGTLGAAVTGYQRGHTAFAISAERGVARGEPQRWDVISDVSERVGRWLLDRTGPPILLNVNVPNRPFAELLGARIVKPVTWGNLDRARLDARPEGEDAWRITASIIREVPYPSDPETDSGAVMGGYVAISHVAPTGWAHEPAPHDLGQLVQSLTPVSDRASIIRTPAGKEGAG